MKYKLTIPGRLPGLNELIEAERANRYKGAQLKKDAERRICAEIRRQLHGVHIRRPVVMGRAGPPPGPGQHHRRAQVRPGRDGPLQGAAKRRLERDRWLCR